MLYTRKGDGGDTGFFKKSDKRESKNSVRTEALGTCDELNSYLGLCKVVAEAEFSHISVAGRRLHQIINEIQQNLFSVQAEIAGAPKHIAPEKVSEMERIISDIEKELPPIKTFFVSGGTALGALIDFARAISRRTERRVVAVSEEVNLGTFTSKYMNRLSSLLYALARLVNHKSGIKEEPPTYL